MQKKCNLKKLIYTDNTFNQQFSANKEISIFDDYWFHFRTFVKQMQSFGANHVLEHFTILRHLTELNQWYIQAFTQFGNTTYFCERLNLNNGTRKTKKIYSVLIFKK